MVCKDHHYGRLITCLQTKNTKQIIGFKKCSKRHSGDQEAPLPRYQGLSFFPGNKEEKPWEGGSRFYAGRRSERCKTHSKGR